ncbi:hypothetical protein SARC_05628 [Sphaeroforma arctica JP610]|uniref:Phospholipase A2 domain-containing protein n=1 Tax=Sphaeroforma arctica JP610 TaxID=667725 RepID=A0A0L0FZ30_9EUKA|nr:hypothetical protein SARC_05628 [Sphaeroforma arctica JP610]KNC82077.1 hypothetical protein SARC_05628 [Sphaeroforma arctica JP610]|eukprot:XP_014155979.1 hypothetical protein SARC_05628 [Sphaeroforma arctica JP610]
MEQLPKHHSRTSILLQNHSSFSRRAGITAVHLLIVYYPFASVPPQIGGFQDCCGGQPCPNCKIKHGVVPASLLTPECLAECPPTDILDHACAWHDACTFSHDRPLNFTCSPQGNECFCDCTLVRTTYNLTCPSYSCTAYRAALDELFLHGTACYVKDENGTMTCEGLRSGIGLYTHCDKGEPVFGNTTANVIPENGSGPGKRRLHGRIVGDETRGATGNGNEIDNEIGLGDEKEGVAVEENAEGLY